MLRQVAAGTIHIIHYVVVISILFAFLIPAGEWLKYHIILICVLMLDWNDMDNQCVLTALEAKLRGTWKPGGAVEGNDRPAFWRPFLRKMGIHVTRARADRLNYFLFVLSLLVCFLRYCAYKRIPLSLVGRTGMVYGSIGLGAAVLWTMNELWRVPPASA